MFGTDYRTPNGTAIRDYVHVSDLADAHVAALRLLPTGKAAGAFNLGTGSWYSVKQVLDAAAETGESLACSTALRRAVADASLSHSEFDFTPRHSGLKNIVQTAWSWHRCAHPKLANEELAGPVSDLPPIGTCGPALKSSVRSSRSIASEANAYGSLGTRAWSVRRCFDVCAQVDCTLLTVTRRDLDLTRQAEVEAWMQSARPQAVFLAAAKVGGIVANDRWPAHFLYDNLAISRERHSCCRGRALKSCCFLAPPASTRNWPPQPIEESALLTGPLEPTNEWYAIAKIAGLKLCQAYRRRLRLRFHRGDAHQSLRP